jgi:acetyl esterase/lipase
MNASSKTLQPPPERPGRPAPSGLAERRRMMAEGLAAGGFAGEPAPREDRLGGVRVLRFAPPGERRGVVLHFHGGGYRLGCPEISAAYATALAARCGVEVVCPAYRLAPEHPFPAGLVDGHAAWVALCATEPGPRILSGDSAGGGLAAAVAALCAAGGPQADGLVLLSAWLDVSVTSPAYRANAATDPLFSEASAAEAAELYLQGWPAQDPLASPLLAAGAGFPPALVSIGEGEVLADDGRKFAAALQAAGVPARLQAVAGMEHVAVTRGMHLTGAAETFAAVAGFIDEVTGAAAR